MQPLPSNQRTASHASRTAWSTASRAKGVWPLMATRDDWQSQPANHIISLSLMFRPWQCQELSRPCWSMSNSISTVLLRSWFPFPCHRLTIRPLASRFSALSCPLGWWPSGNGTGFCCSAWSSNPQHHSKSAIWRQVVLPLINTEDGCQGAKVTCLLRYIWYGYPCFSTFVRFLAGAI